jgi:Carbon-nitrogen hydrolase
MASLCIAARRAILGGLADYSDNPGRFAIRTDTGELAFFLAPLASDTVTSIVGFTELSRDGTLYNASAIFQRGRVAGLYRKIRPAIGRSVYSPGLETPVFCAGELTFGIVICNDSNHPELSRHIAAQGATALFIPTNNGLPNRRHSLELNVAVQKDGHRSGNWESFLGDPRRCRRPERSIDLFRVFGDRRSQVKCGPGTAPRPDRPSCGRNRRRYPASEPLGFSVIVLP